MLFCLANYKQEIILDEVFVGGSMMPFTLQRYINSTKLPKVRLYLASRSKIDEKNMNKQHLETIDEPTTCNNEQWESDDDVLYQSAFYTHDYTNQETSEFATNQSMQSTQSTSLCTQSTDQSPETRKYNNSNKKTSDFEANRILKAEQDKDFQASLAADQAKEKERLEQLQAHVKKVEQQEKLRMARKLRVPDEPEERSDVDFCKYAT